jgi:hypothetical protein
MNTLNITWGTVYNSTILEYIFLNPEFLNMWFTQGISEQLAIVCGLWRQKYLIVIFIPLFVDYLIFMACYPSFPYIRMIISF